MSEGGPEKKPPKSPELTRMERKSFQERLGISRGATHDQIKDAFYALSKIHHPDRGGNPEMFKLISEAHSALMSQKSGTGSFRDGNDKGGADRETIREMKVEIDAIKTLDEAQTYIPKILAEITQPQRQGELVAYLHRQVERVLEKMLANCADLESQKAVRDSMIDFLKTSEGGIFRKVAFMDILDNGALNIGKRMLLRAVTRADVENAMQAIREHPFAFASVYEKPFAESQADAIAKIDFLIALRRKKSPTGLDELRKEVAAFQFNDTKNTNTYRDQIFGFIERKREIYWPENVREHMPKID